LLAAGEAIDGLVELAVRVEEDSPHEGVANVEYEDIFGNHCKSSLEIVAHEDSSTKYTLRLVHGSLVSADGEKQP